MHELEQRLGQGSPEPTITDVTGPQTRSCEPTFHCEPTTFCRPKTEGPCVPDYYPEPPGCIPAVPCQPFMPCGPMVPPM